MNFSVLLHSILDTISTGTELNASVFSSISVTFLFSRNVSLPFLWEKSKAQLNKAGIESCALSRPNSNQPLCQLDFRLFPFDGCSPILPSRVYRIREATLEIEYVEQWGRRRWNVRGLFVSVLGGGAAALSLLRHREPLEHGGREERRRGLKKP